LIKPSPWTTISRRRRTARGSLAIRVTLSHSTRSTILLMGMEVIAHTGITVISTRGMATISMVTSSMEDPGEIIPMGITVEKMAVTMGVTHTPMEIMASTDTIQKTCPILPATSVRRLGTFPLIARRISPLKLPKQIHSRRDR
jgi:hypothetical protein